jgi:urease accessory protein
MLIFDRLGGDPARLVGETGLEFEWRQKSRMRLIIESGARAGEEAGFELPRGTVLRDGELISTASGECLRIVAAAEDLIHIEAASPTALARIAYHLGNRHVPLQIGEGWLRLQYDHVLENMVRGLGGTVAMVEAGFDPESGAYGFGRHAHAHAHAHGHGHEHGHDHDHAHQHAHDHGHGEGATCGAADADGHGHRHGHDDRRHAPKIHDFLTDPLQPR